ncbi:MAG: carbon-nitrogen hydrolase family protein [Myxococcales bacterium]|nr:carbon-nitrogen hydrolase family protein [Myxococcales bacterium]
MFLAAAVQLNGSSDSARCLDQAVGLIRRAASYGARFVATPEATNFLGPHADKVRRAESLQGPTCQHFAELARELGIHLLLGSFNEKADDEHRCYNTSVLFGPDGRQLATYRKIHLFDVDVSPQLRFLESDTALAGDTPVTAQTPLAHFGLSICYDLRFGELYRTYRDRGANVLLVPSAFTLSTGKDHWEPLLRTRAIETQSYVIAPGQHGTHDDGGLRQSWGHSMIIDPWGHVVGMASDGPGLALAEVQLDRVDRARTSMPISSHRRLT